ncbi:MAG: polysaccharide deacetylase family protein [Cytophagaceae bacterium]|nr:polysaccharide deacetylase family protein [Cytophagaceae bacterium]MBK9508061.1 polysaccharide deacetylase family protein [Cytophagaceae bacterium]MBK9936467.1 polysaccharide deacetylase family protein [Cytophagaceae bacterium]MBL0300216.1 polysaccharide deacetylase family protein [Cytophagaceae bacterium]MBL0327153.1 polysaccharide deacetylase family protein [Cytophagaceae bacterium]
MAISKLLNTIFPKYLWKVDRDEKVIYLTFDDGPVPYYTDFVLDQLKKYNASATFFCVGENIKKHPEVFQKLINEGHYAGNHTFNHLKGWNTENKQYIDNFLECQLEIEKFSKSGLFRPPYGRIKKKQAEEILKTHKIIMWSVLTRDYDSDFDAEKCLKNAIKKTENGSIVLFHDSEKAWKNLSYVLPRYLEYFSEKGYSFEPLV